MELKDSIVALMKEGRSKELTLSIVVAHPGITCGGTPTVPVKAVFHGFDWDSGKVLFYPEQTLTKLSDEQLELMKKAMVDGSPYQIQKQLERTKERQEAGEKVLLSALTLLSRISQEDGVVLPEALSISLKKLLVDDHSELGPLFARKLKSALTQENSGTD